MPKRRPLVYSYDRVNFDPPAPVLEVSLSTPGDGPIVKSLALLDSGADITAIPLRIVQQLQLKYVDEGLVSGYDGIPRKTLVYSTKITIESLGDYVVRVVASKDDYVLIGRDILNRWFLLLKGRNKTFEIS